MQIVCFISKLLFISFSWNGTWISDRYFSFSDENNSIWIYDCHRLSKELVFARDLIQDESVDEGIVSPSARFILIPIRKEKVLSIINRYNVFFLSIFNQTHPYYNVYQYNLYEKKKLIDQQTLPISSIVYSHSDEFFVFKWIFLKSDITLMFLGICIEF